MRNNKTLLTIMVDPDLLEKINKKYPRKIGNLVNEYFKKMV